MSLHSTLRDASLRPQATPLSAPEAVRPAPLNAKKPVRRLPATKGLWLSIATLVSVVALWWAVT
ncbi:taurine transporter subunit, partial [Yersinia enterocolitica]